MILHTPKTPFKGFLLLAIAFSTSSCNAEQNDAFDPLFSGMPSGEYISRNCIHINGFSIQKIEKELESELSVYSSEPCGGDAIHRATLDRDTQLAGVWGHYLVLDYGTGPDSRDIELIDLSESESNFRSTYVMEPEFAEQSLSFYKPAEEMVAPEKCDEGEEEAKTWSEMGLGVGIAQKMTFQSGTTGATVESETACYHIQ